MILKEHWGLELGSNSVYRGNNDTTVGGVAGGAGTPSLGSSTGSIGDFAIASATSGIGIIKTIGATTLKLELLHWKQRV
jgi:hypothetical protein